DHDGDGDLYVGEHDGYLNVFINEGGYPPNFSCLTTALDSFDVGKHCAPHFWDIDLDGDLDLFMGNENGNIWHYRNDGDAANPDWTLVTSTFIAPLLVDYHAIPFFADLDADGDDDLLVGHNGGGAAHFLNAGSPGAPAWSAQSSFYAGLDVGTKSSVCIFDVDNDTLKDIFMAGVEGEIHYYQNDGPPENPTYSFRGIVYDVGHNGTPTFCDLDGDGDLDLVSGESDGNLNHLTNIGTPEAPDWEETSRQFGYLDCGFRSVPALADLNDDGDLDLFIGRLQGGITFLENVGTPDSAAWLLRNETYAGLDLPGKEAVTFYDLDGDDDLDMVVGDAVGTLTYLENGGTPQAPDWQPPVYNYTGIDVGGDAVPVLIDIDADADADLFIGSFSGTVRYLRNDGTSSAPNWNDIGDFPGIDVGNFSTPAFGDIDDDGDYDLISGNGPLAGFLVFYRNIGSALFPSFTLETTAINGWDFGDHSAPCLGDLDGDTDPDMLVGCEAGGIWYWENLGVLLNVTLAMQPYDPPVVIPAGGGSFLYVLRVENLEAFATHFFIWSSATFPDGVTTVPVDTFEMTLQPGAISDIITVDIPGAWPAGGYVFDGIVGESSDLIYSSASFTFEKEDSVGVKEETDFLPDDYSLTLYPNPFNAAINANLTLPTVSNVELSLYDVSGRLIATLADRWFTSGTHRLQFDAGNLAAGVYFLHAETVGGPLIQKLVYLK
ncbi:MAG: T9SS type A sorting domain-containing protein, partial [bacterium]